jgi:hypothetical protein
MAAEDDAPLPGYVDRILDGDRRRKKERRKAKRRGEPTQDSPAGTHHLDIEGYGEIEVYRSPHDGALVVDINTGEASIEAGTADFDTRPRIRVSINDDWIWENPPYFPEELDDTESSASRQHYIDTGSYLKKGQANDA